MKSWILLNFVLLLSLSLAAQIDKNNFIGLYYGYTLYKAPGSQGTKGYNKTIKVTNNNGEDSLNLFYSTLNTTYVLRLMEDSTLMGWSFYPDHGGKFYSGGDSIYFSTFSPSGMGMYTWEFWGHRTATGIEDQEVKEATLFPNPAENELNVILPGTEKGKYRILTAAGQLMLEGDVNRAIKLNIHRLAAGAYIFEYTSDHQIISRPFFKGL